MLSSSSHEYSVKVSVARILEFEASVKRSRKSDGMYELESYLQWIMNIIGLGS